MEEGGNKVPPGKALGQEVAETPPDDGIAPKAEAGGDSVAAAARLPNVSHILLAEFDIDKGSTLRYQVPQPVPFSTPDALADKMLPDGAQNQEWDWNMFFLNRALLQNPKKLNSSEEGWELIVNESSTGQEQQEPPAQPTNSDKEEEEDHGMLYCLTLIHCRKDDRVRRGATIRSLCLCTHFSFVNVFRPLVFRALQEYFHEPTLETLTQLYAHVNSLNLSTVSQIIRATRMWSQYSIKPLYTFLDASFWEEAAKERVEQDVIKVPLHYGLDQVEEIHLLHLFRTFKVSGVVNLYYAILLQKRVLVLGHNRPASEVCQCVLSLIALTCPPLWGILAERCFPYVSLHDIEYATASGPFTSVKGFIAGTTNPFFREHCQWEVLADLEKGQVVIAKTAEFIFQHIGENRLSQASSSGGFSFKKSKSIAPSSSRSSSSSLSLKGDSDQQQKPGAKLISQLKKGILLRCGEDWMRQKFKEHTLQMLELALETSTVETHSPLQSRASPTSSSSSISQSFLLVIKELKTTEAFKRFRRWVNGGFNLNDLLSPVSSPSSSTSSFRTRRRANSSSILTQEAKKRMVVQFVRQLHISHDRLLDLSVDEEQLVSLDNTFANLLALVRSEDDLQEFLAFVYLYFGEVEVLHSLLPLITSEPLRLQASLFLSRLLDYKDKCMRGDQAVLNSFVP
ncbi:Docking domain of Afi1 for Arf3 in vesicle trafficking-domain-containing protein [Balamuthia mandrillaris]